MSNFVDGVSKDKSTHGVSEKYVPKSNIDENLEELDRDGYTILKKAFSEEDCAKAKEKIDKVYEVQIDESGGEDYLISINDQNVARALFVYDNFFVKFCLWL